MLRPVLAKVYDIFIIDCKIDDPILQFVINSIKAESKEAQTKIFFIYASLEKKGVMMIIGLGYREKKFPSLLRKYPDLFSPIDFVKKLCPGRKISNLKTWAPSSESETHPKTEGLRKRQILKKLPDTEITPSKDKRGIYGTFALFFHFVNIMEEPVFFNGIRNYHIMDVLSIVIRGATRNATETTSEREIFHDSLDEENAITDKNNIIEKQIKNIDIKINTIIETLESVKTNNRQNGEKIEEKNPPNLSGDKPILSLSPSKLLDEDWLLLKTDYFNFMQQKLGNDENFFKLFLSDLRDYGIQKVTRFQKYQLSYQTFRKHPKFKKIKSDFLDQSSHIK